MILIHGELNDQVRWAYRVFHMINSPGMTFPIPFMGWLSW